MFRPVIGGLVDVPAPNDGGVPSGVAGGDLGGSYPSPSVLKVNGVSPGSLTETVSSVLTISNGAAAVLGNVTLQVKQASGSQAGYLSSADWTAFTAKLSSLVASNTLYVDTAGNDGTGTRGRVDLPFATLVAAHTAASAGDSIVMNPGSYTPASGSLTISKNNLSIFAYGALINATSGTDYTKLVITGNSVSIYGLEIDGKYVSGSDTNVGLIQVGGADCNLISLYLHDHASKAIRTVLGSNRLRVHRCRIVNANDGIKTTNYAASGAVSGMQFTNNIFESNRNDGIAHFNEGWTGSATSVAFFGTLISNNTFRNNVKTAIELYQGNVDGAVIDANYIANSQYGISIAGVTHTKVSNNNIKCGSYCGIEFAFNPDNAGNLASNNLIDCLNESGSYTGATGYAVSSVSGNHNAQLTIEGGWILNTGTGGGGGTGGGIGLANFDNVIIRNVGMVGLGNFVTMTDSNYVTVENCRVESTNADGSCYFIWTSATPSATRSGFFYRNNSFNRVNSTSGYPPFQLYPTASTGATFNEVYITGNLIRNQTFAGSGYINVGVNTVNAIVRSNFPTTTTDSQHGFLDDLRTYNLRVTNAVDFGTGTLPATAGNVNATGLAVSGQIQTGTVTPAGIGAAGDLILGKSASTGTLYFGTNGASSIDYDGTNFTLNHTVRPASDGGSSLGSSSSRRWFNLFLSNMVLWGNATDLGLARNTGGVLEINNGTAGTFRDIKLRTLICGATQATNMTDGFIQIPGAAGAATGTPTNAVGIPLYFDTTNLQLYAYVAGAWKKSAAFT